MTVWLWLTVVFANLAEAVAEGRGRAQAATLRATRRDTTARRLGADGAEELVAATELRLGDRVVCEAGDTIPGDGDVVDGVASVDESAITGESAPVIRESGGDRSAVTGGTKVLSDRIVVEITAAPGHTFIDRMIALVEGASRQKTPNEIALNILLSSLTIIFLLVVMTLQPLAEYSGAAQSVIVLVALLVCLIPTTIGALLSAIGIAGMDRLVQRNVLAMSGRAVEAAGDVSTLLLDKTGTITLGNRQAVELMPAPGVSVEQLADAAQLSSLADETPEGRSIVVLCKDRYGLRARDEGALLHAVWVPFTAQTRMSGVDVDGRSVRKGAAGAVFAHVASEGGTTPVDVSTTVDAISSAGGTPLVVSEGAEVLGVIHLKDVVKSGIRERFEELRRMGIRTVMITGDNPMTARAIAEEAGVDDFLAEATPEDKMALIQREQDGGRLVAMTGDGTNDAPALAQADVGVAMNTGTSAAKEAGNMVDLDSNPTKLIDIVEIGKQLLITRGALTTFSVANDVAKYFAIIPAMFVVAYPGLERTQRDGPGQPELGDPVGGGLQRARHHRAHPAGPARRPLPPGERQQAAQPQSVDLRTWRHHRAVRRHQAARPADLPYPRNGVMTMTLTLRQGWVAVRFLLIMTVVLGVLYPVAIFAVGRVVPGTSDGSYVTDASGAVVGSAHIGQVFDGAEWFLPRPSAAGDGYDALSSGGTNLAADNPDLVAAVAERKAAAAAADGVDATSVPADAVTASGSGLDPDISPEYALQQVATGGAGPRAGRGHGPPAGRPAARRDASSASSASRESTCCSSISRWSGWGDDGRARRPDRRSRTIDSLGPQWTSEPWNAAHLPRCRAGRRQDLRHARRGAPSARARHRRGGRARRDPRARATPRT